MPEQPSLASLPVPGGRIEACTLPGGPGRTVVVLGGVETGLRPLAGSESVLLRRWVTRLERRPVLVLGRPIPDDPADADRLLHPRLIADAVAHALVALPVEPSVAIEAESGGGRISLWLTVDHPPLVERLVLVSVASETPFGTPMAVRMAQWIELGERGEWGEFFARLALQMRPAGGAAEANPDTRPPAAGTLQPRPATPERFLAELRATLDRSSFVTDRLGEISVPTLVLAGGRDQVVPVDATRLVAERIPGARYEVDPDCGHGVRSTFRGYDALVEAFLAEGD